MTDSKDNNPPPKSISSSNSSSSENSSLPQLPQLPSSSLKESLRTAVSATNRALASLEAVAGSVRDPVVNTWHQVADTGTAAAAGLATAYDRRHEYGPFAIGATGLATGAIVTFRRGRLPGAVAAVLASGVAYGVIYGLDGGSQVIEQQLPAWMDRFKKQD